MTYQLINLLTCCFFIVSLFVILTQLATKMKNQLLKRAELTYLKNIESLVCSVKSQRHDHFNHLYVIRNLLKKNKLGEMEKYLNTLCGDILNNQNLLKINNLPLSALIDTKIQQASTKSIKITVHANTHIKKLKMQSYELIKIVGNLIDNAIQEEEKILDRKREITISIDDLVSSYLVISIHNKNSYLKRHEYQSIFKKGYSSHGKNRGLGLFITQQLLKKYNGHISVESNYEGTTFSVFIPYN